MGTARLLPQLVEQSGHKVLKSPADTVFAGQRYSQASRQQGAQKGRGRHG